MKSRVVSMVGVLAVSVVMAQVQLASAQTVLTSTRVASGLSSPLYVVSPPGDFNRVFIVEQPGRIKILTGGAVLGTPFLDITGLVAFGGERGLLGLAFHPNYATNGFFYVNYTQSGAPFGATKIVRYSVLGDPNTSNVADAGSAVVLKTISQPESNHNGGDLEFGPDGMLYTGMGDGGGANDQHGAIGNSQDTGTLLGKMLRLDVDNPPDYIPVDNPFVGAGDPLDEIWAIGLRNPWRFSFDRLTGDMYIGDVGQNAREELDFQPAASTGGENYGWRCMEASLCTGLTGCTCNAPELTLPFHEYALGGSPFRCSIIGGYVYRGSAIPGLQGTYFFGDFCSNQIWSLRYDGVTITEFTDRTAELTPDVGTIASISSFGEDAAGEIYVCDLNGGEVFKILADIIDCNANGIPDAQDIAGGTSADCNNNAVPDECDIQFGSSTDCNNNTIPDECDVTAGTSLDCQLNGIPDECEPPDCNLNGIPDDCDITGGTSLDCQPDGVPDECGLIDCNLNGVPDDCDIAGATSLDCQPNGVPDECDPDCDHDGIPDACDGFALLFEDNFETDQGWTVTSEPGTGGIWERAAPVEIMLSGAIQQPGEDNPAGTGTLCYVTDGAGGFPFQGDVDGGPTRLMSPQINLSAGSGIVSYAYWMFSSGGTGNDDSLIVEVSNDDGVSWVLLATHDVSASVWRTHSASVDSVIVPTDTMRIRFRIEDTNGASFTDAAVDDVSITGADCPPAPNGDIDGDGDVDSIDYDAFAECLGGPAGPPNPTPPPTVQECLGTFDFNFDGDVDLGDFRDFAALYTG